MRTYAMIAFCILGLCLGLLTESCKKEPPVEPEKPSTIQLVFEDASCTEAWLRITLTDASEPRTVALKRDGTTVLTARLTANDTMVLDTNLLPKRNYSYQAVRLNNNTLVDTSPTLQVTTMDTTSHDYAWQVDSLGESSSVLFDAAILNDTLTYVVGDINIRDNNGLTEPPYGLAKLTTTGWHLIHLYVNNPTGGTSILRPRGILAFSATDVWLANAGVFHWDGQTIVPYWLNAFPGNPNPILDPGQGIERLTGTSSANICGVGTQGAVAVYNGQQWARKDVSITVDLLDAWMNTQSITWACGYPPNYSESILLRHNGTTWEQYGHSPPWGLYADLFGSVWFYKNDSAYVVGNQGVFRHAQGSPTGYRRIPIDLGYFPFKIRGAARNDVAIVGENAMIWHFNGVTWKRFDQLINPLDRLHSVAIGYNQIVAVGYRYYNGVDNHAIIYHGRR